MRVEDPEDYPDMEVNLGWPIFTEVDTGDQAYFIKKGLVTI